MNQLGIRNDGLAHRIGRTEVLDDPLVDDGRDALPFTRNGVAVHGGGFVMLHLVQRGHVRAGHLGDSAKDLLSGCTGIAKTLVRAADLDDGLLALADQDGVEERREGLGIVDGGAARYDQGIVLAAIGGVEGDAGEVHRLEIVRAGHLMRHMEAHDVEGRQGGSALEREQRNAGAPHLIGHVDPGDVAALAGDTLLLVQYVIEDGDTLIGKADLIGIGIDEAGSIVRIG